MVDYCHTDISQNPRCPHGPTLLFSRKCNQRKFFVCSAFRDRKSCSFFQWMDSVSKKNKEINYKTLEKRISSFTARRNQVLSFKSISTVKCFCYTCEMVISVDEKLSHKGHSMKENIDENMLNYPTLLINPKEESKAESQYYFSENAVNMLTNFLTQTKTARVLCIGCPYLHEFITNTKENVLTSMLLDIDPRYLQFYSSDQFQLFNMFNFHTYDSDGWSHIKLFLNTGRLAVVVDPPFGGRLEPLAYTINRLMSFYKTENKSEEKEDVLVLLVLPYFMEPVVKQSLPDFHMLDYKVEYRNHRQFRRRGNSSGNRGSAVRVFTNFDPSRFSLAAEEGYKYCRICDRWVYNENMHCYKCNACTSKNGGIYKHCDRCGKCVKKTWDHCETCKICKLSDHICHSDLLSSPTEMKNESGKSTKKRKRRSNKK